LVVGPRPTPVEEESIRCQNYNFPILHSLQGPKFTPKERKSPNFGEGMVGLGAKELGS